MIKVNKFSLYLENKEQGEIAVDFDGTLVSYSNYKTQALEIGEPIKSMVDRVKDWLDQGKKIVIFTARAKYKDQIPLIKQWCKDNLGQELDVTNVKRETFTEIWDDLAKQVERNKGTIKDER